MWDEYIIVDDNKFDRLICARMVEKIDQGASFAEFSNGAEILDYIVSNDFKASKALIFLDINMPTMSGFDFLAAMREHAHGKEIEQRVNVAFITSSSRDEDRELAAHYKFVIGFVQKPLIAKHIAEVVEKFSLQ